MRREELGCAPEASCLQRCGDLHTFDTCSKGFVDACALAQPDVEVDCDYTTFEYEGMCCQAEMDAYFDCVTAGFP